MWSKFRDQLNVKDVIIPKVYGERELTKHHSREAAAYAQAQQTKVVVGMTLLMTFNCSVK